MLKQTTYIDRDNSTDLVLEADDAAIDATVLTRAVVSLYGDAGAIVVDSNAEPALFDFATGGGVLKMKLGLATGLVVDEYQARLTVYDASNAQGIVWGDPFILNVLPAP